jgi:hypothetical protein
MEEHLVTTLLEEAKGGKRIFRKEAEQAAAKAINERFTPAVTITLKHVKNKLANASEPNLSTRWR